jgi:hypothetical protein
MLVAAGFGCDMRVSVLLRQLSNNFPSQFTFYFRKVISQRII